MGRRRLLTILAGVAAASGLLVLPTSAQIGLPGVGGISVGDGGGGGISVEITTELEGVLEGDTTVSLTPDSEAPLEVTSDAKVLDQPVPVEEIAQPVAEVVNETLSQVTGSQPGDDSADPDADPGPTAGGQQAGDTADAASAAQAVVARREFGAASIPPGSSASRTQVMGPPAPAHQLDDATSDAAALPEVAPSLRGGSDAEDAVAFATTDPVAAEVPFVLKLLVGALILAGAAVWSMAVPGLQAGRSQTTTG